MLHVISSELTKELHELTVLLGVSTDSRDLEWVKRLSSGSAAIKRTCDKVLRKVRRYK